MDGRIISARFETCLEALSHIERRRLLLALLNDASDGGCTIDLEEPLDQSAHHVHLPKLETSGFISVDRRRHTVTTGPSFEEIRPLLELLDENRSQLPDGWA